MPFVCCDDCLFWDEPDEGRSWGECHRHAPVVVQVLIDGGGGETRWPATKGGDGCGDGEPTGGHNETT
jgi:hypothetical protein